MHKVMIGYWFIEAWIGIYVQGSNSLDSVWRNERTTNTHIPPSIIMEIMQINKIEMKNNIAVQNLSVLCC